MRTRATVMIVTGVTVALIAAIARPDAAHLVFQGLLVGAVVILLIELLAATLQRLPTSRWAANWRRAPRRRPPVPRAIGDLAQELRLSRRRLSVRIASLLAQQLDGKLALDHGLDTTDPDQLEAARNLLSEHAFYLVALRRHPDSRARAGLADIPRSWLPHLLNELEQP